MLLVSLIGMIAFLGVSPHRHSLTALYLLSLRCLLYPLALFLPQLGYRNHGSHGFWI